MDRTPVSRQRPSKTRIEWTIACLLLGRFVQFDRISIGVVDLDLLAPRSRLDLVPESGAARLERGDSGVDLLHVEDDSVPSARLLLTTIRHRSRARASRTAQEETQVSAGDDRHRSGPLRGPETQVPRVERDSALEIANLVAHHSGVRVRRERC